MMMTVSEPGPPGPRDPSEGLTRTGVGAARLCPHLEQVRRSLGGAARSPSFSISGPQDPQAHGQ